MISKRNCYSQTPVFFWIYFLAAGWALTLTPVTQAQTPPGCLHGGMAPVINVSATAAHVGDVISITHLGVSVGSTSCNVTNGQSFIMYPNANNVFVAGPPLGTGLNGIQTYQTNFSLTQGETVDSIFSPPPSAAARAVTTNYVVDVADMNKTLSFATPRGFTSGSVSGSPDQIKFLAISDAIITGSDGSQTLGGQASTAVQVLIPCIGVTKQCSLPEGQSCFPIGRPIVFSGVVTNCGNTPLFNITVTDNPQATNITFAVTTSAGRSYDGTLNENESIAYTGSYIPAGSPSCTNVEDTVTAVGTDALNLSVTNTATTSCEVCCPPKICVTKAVACAPAIGSCDGTLTYSSSATAIAGPTDLAAFCYRITISNCGPDILTNVTVTDNLIPSVAGSFPTTLGIGECWTNFFGRSYGLSNGGSSTNLNTVTATGTGSSSGVTTNAVAGATAIALAITPLNNLAACPGTSATFITTASSEAQPLTYVWRKNGQVVAGQTTNSLTIASAGPSDVATYTVEVTGTCNTVTNSATLTVSTNTSATALGNVVTCQGQPATFSTTASGTGPFTYVWKHNGTLMPNQTGSSITFASADLPYAGTYKVEVTGSCNSVTNTGTLVVNQTTSSTALTSLIRCPGQNATFSTVASGAGPFTYAWSKDGQPISGATGSIITIFNVTSADAGSYSVLVSGVCNSVEPTATLRVNTNTSATALTDLVLCPGHPATFSTVASGTGPFTYVWKKNGSVQSSTSNTLSIASVAASDAATYTVEVSGNCTSVTNSAMLTVNTNTTASALTDVVVCQGQPASFATTASGTGPFTYVWKQNGNVLSGVTDSSISILSTALTNAGTYTVEVTGLCNTVTNTGLLTVNQATASSALTSLILCPGQNATFATVPSGTGPFTYVWTKDSQVIAGATASTLTINAVNAGSAGTYNVHVNGTCNSVDQSATLTVNTNTGATSLTDLVLCPGQSATFSTVASGTGPFTYVWKKNGIVQSSTSDTLSIATVSAVDAGVYSVEVSGVCNSVTNSATLTVNTNVTATALPNLAVCPGNNATFSTTVTGTGPYVFVWKKDGVVQSSTSNVLTVTSAAIADAGTYSVEVSGLCNAVTNTGTLTINQITSSSALTSLTNCPGTAATFTTVPSGTGPFTYVWKKDGVVQSSTNNSLTIGAVASVDAGNYSVEVIGACNTVTNSATLVVQTNTTATPLNNLALCPGSDATFSTTVSGTGPFTFIWKKNGVVQSSTSNLLTVPSLTSVDAGTYSVEVTGTCNSVTNSAVLTVNTLTAATDLISLTNCAGTTATFSTSPSGTGPFSYIWTKDNVVQSSTSNSFVVASVSAASAGTYSVVVSGACNAVTNTATLTVNPVTAASALTTLVLCPGSSANFSTVATGTGPFAYVWKKNGVVQPSTSDSLSLASITAADGGTYTVEVTGACGAVTNSATLTVNQNTGASSLLNLTNCPGTTATFTTIASGTGPFGYVWRKDGVVQASTTNSLVVASVSAADAGTYTVEVTGTCTSITNSATLTVNDTTTATSLTNITTCPGTSASFSTVASGSGPITYRWRKGATALLNQTNATLTIGSVVVADAGTYSVEVAGACNAVTNSATLSVNPPTTATALANVTACPNDPVTFTTTASGTGPFSYVWRKDGVAQGSTSNVLMVASASAADAGTYSVEVTGICNSVTNSATLHVNQATTSSALTNSVNCPGTFAYFMTLPAGTGPFTFVWKKDGVVQSSTSNTLAKASVSAADAGTYTVEVSGACNKVTNSATITVNTPTSASALTNVIACPGDAVSFSTAAAGTGPFSYVWRKDGVIQSSTSNVLEIASASAADVGIYRVEVTGTCNTVTNTATLSVRTPATLASWSDISNCSGTPVSFTANASGSGPFAYVWKKNDVAISGQTNSDYAIASTLVSDSGTYSVEVTGPCNSATNTAVLTVNAGTFGTALTNVSACLGQSASFSTVASGGGPFSYVWRRNGTLLSETSDTLAIGSVTTGDAGTYSVEIIGSCNTITNHATLVVNSPVTATALNDLIRCVGQSATFSTVAGGTGPFTYVWRKDGVVQGSTSNTLTIAGVTNVDAGTYSVEVTGTCDSVTNSATLTVNSRTSASALSSLVRCAGDSATFTTTASGTGPFTYIWKKNGTVQGSTSNELTIATATGADAGTYTVEVSGTCNTVTNAATLTMNTPTTSSALVDLVRCSGQPASFTTTPSGTGPFTYVWKKDGVTQSSTSNTLAIAAVGDIDVGTYSVEVSGQCNAVTNSATLSVNSNTTATALIDVGTCAGQSVGFSTVASGTGPLTYVWKKNGIVQGSTSNSLEISSSSVTDSGTYSVEVTGACTSVTNSATLTVNTTTATALTNVAAWVGDNVSFTTVASGPAPLAFVWRKDGTLINDQTNSVLTIDSVTNSDYGTYSVEVTSSCGSITNSAVLTQDSISAPLQNLNLDAGDTLSLNLTAVGGPFTYQWKQNGQPIPGATTSSLVVSNVVRANAGTYAVDVTHSSTTTSDPANVVITDPVIKKQPLSGNIGFYTPFAVAVEAHGTPIPGFSTGLHYQWYFKKNGSSVFLPLAGKTNADLGYRSMTPLHVGQYFCVVSNRFLPGETVVPGANVITSAVATLTGFANPKVARQPANLKRVAGQNAQFAAVIRSAGLLNYQWDFNGVPIPGATTSVYSLTNVQMPNAGTYTCNVTNSIGLTNRTSTNWGHLTVVLDAASPVSLITYPHTTKRILNGSTSTNGAIIVTAPDAVLAGRAVDDGLITNVMLTRIFPDWAPPLAVDVALFEVSPSKKLWTDVVTLVDGTNTFVATASDNTGKTGASDPRIIFLRTLTPLTMNIHGSGTTQSIPPSAGVHNTAQLEVNRNYLIKAIPNSGVNFVNWTDANDNVLTNTPVLQFTMTNGIILNANFDH